MNKKEKEKASQSQPSVKTPVHQWTHKDGEALILRFSDKRGKAYRGVQHPLEIGATVTAPDWNPEPVCGGGIHGWPWGIGLGSGKDPDWSALWQVYGVNPACITANIEDEPKCKFREGVLRFSGTWHEAMLFILEGQKAWVEHFAEGKSNATGNRSAANATGDSSAANATGYSSAANATGDSSAANATGDSSAANATGYRSAANATGYRSAANATGYSSAANATGNSSAANATGDSSAANATGKATAAFVTGCNSKARAGEYGCIALAWWNSDADRAEMRCAEIGNGDGSDGKLKANTWYELNEQGQFVEV